VKAKPTSGELMILQVLWDRGPSTVRQVHESLEDKTDAGYTTTLKLMQIMAEKGLVERDQRERAHVYRAALKQDETQGRLVDELVERAFGGSAAALVMRALSTRKSSPTELAEIRRMLDEYEGGAR
jgi:predicted transcriptional regulator